jgi:adenosyl cobinamide kinase/adenosyl cobinamide phosphate guanylyltransferase
MAFRDALGDLNRYIAGLADQVWFVVAGIPMKIGGLDSKSS